MARHTLSVLVEDQPGVLARISALFSRRGYNIESLTVGHTETPGISRMTVVVDTDEYGARRLEAHLYKLVPVRRVENITSVPSLSRDLALVKVNHRKLEQVTVKELSDTYAEDLCHHFEEMTGLFTRLR